MLKFAANLSFLFPDRPFLDRFAAAAAAGFKAVEFAFAYEHAESDVAAAARATGVRVVLLNLPPGDWAAGERGTTCLPGREPDCLARQRQNRRTMPQQLHGEFLHLVIKRSIGRDAIYQAQAEGFFCGDRLTSQNHLQRAFLRNHSWQEDRRDRRKRPHFDFGLPEPGA